MNALQLKTVIERMDAVYATLDDSGRQEFVATVRSLLLLTVDEDSRREILRWSAERA